MFIDTHCHITMMIKKDSTGLLTKEELLHAQDIVNEASQHNVTRLITVGTNVIESINCIQLAQKFPHVFATVGIHPHDCTSMWYNDFKKITELASKKRKNKIVAIGECGLDFHYTNYSKRQQLAAFKAHIELALENNLAIVVHTRDAQDETLYILEEFKKQIKKCVIHCFSGNQEFANKVTEYGFMLGIGASITYPKNDPLRAIVKSVSLENLVLETDAPFLPPQIIRGKQNHPKYIQDIAEYFPIRP